MVISTLYLPETAANVQYQEAPARGVCADQKKCSAMTGTARWWFPVIASSPPLDRIAVTA
jgi:hypothetical protein